MNDITKKKLQVIGVIVVFLIIIIAVNQKSTTADTKQQAKMVEVNQVLKTRFFDVTVNNARVQRFVFTDTGYGNLDYKNNSKYLVIDLLIKNTDTESRMAIDGAAFIDYNGKRLKFDKAEIVPGSGYGLSETLNPMISMRTKVVYEIPLEITGQLYYQPGRSSGGEIIHIGAI